MRIFITTLGTRGDVQPYVALALQLQRAGHEVRLAGPEQYAGLAAAHGIDYAPLPGEFLALLETPEGRAAVAGSGGLAAGFKLLKHVKPLMRGLWDNEWRALRDFQPDGIVYHPKSLIAPLVASHLGIGAILASPLPGFTATSAFPSPLLPFGSLGPLNRISHQLAIRGGTAIWAGELRAWCADTLGTSGRLRAALPVATLYAYSPEVLPKPPDWGPEVAVTGYWFLDSDWTPDPSLRRFLEAGEAPVYVGFGSMPGLDDGLTDRVIAAIVRSGRRGLLATAGGALVRKDAPAGIHFIDTAPHDQLFPRVSAAVHHGGAGTTAAALRAGIPMVICPFFGDQPFWARRARALGVAPEPLDRRRLDADELADRIAATAAPATRQRANDLGTRIRAERGPAVATARIEAALSG